MRARGFTLLELVITMGIMAIVAVFSVQFITNSVSIYTQGSKRAQLMSDVRFGLERMNREVRNAIPHSLRIENADGTANEQGACLRFWPITTASRYIDIIKDPTTSNTNVIVPDLSGALTTDDWLVIYPVGLDSSTQQCNENGNNCALPITSIPAPAADQLKFSFASQPQFVLADTQRVYFAREQVRYCMNNKGEQTRATTPIADSFSAVSPTPMAEHIMSGAFFLDNNDLYQMLTVDVTVANNNEIMDFSHKIRLYNAP